MSFSYDEIKYSKTGWRNKRPKYKEKTTTNRIENKYSGLDTSAYKHENGKAISFHMPLPEDKYSNGSSSRYYLINKTTYTNFKAALETSYLVNFDALKLASFKSVYSSNKKKISFDWGKITISPTIPFINWDPEIMYGKNFYNDELIIDFNVRF